MIRQIKSRAFEVVLYPDTQSYDCYSVLKWIRRHYDYVFVLHDKDVYEEDTEDHKKGDLKPKHYHLILRWSGSPRYAAGLSKEMGVESRFFLPIHGEDCKTTSLKSRLRYLVHANELEKYQYPVSDVKGCGKLKELFLLYIGSANDLSDEEKLKQIMHFVRNNRYISTDNFLCFCMDYGLLKFYHKYGREINRLIDEHNYHFFHSRYDLTN